MEQHPHFNMSILRYEQLIYIHRIDTCIQLINRFFPSVWFRGKKAKIIFLPFFVCQIRFFCLNNRLICQSFLFFVRVILDMRLKLRLERSTCVFWAQWNNIFAIIWENQVEKENFVHKKREKKKIGWGLSKFRIFAVRN